MENSFEFGEIVLGKYDDEEELCEAEFLKYDEHMEYGKYVCLTCSHDGKHVECFHEIRKNNNPSGYFF